MCWIEAIVSLEQGDKCVILLYIRVYSTCYVGLKGQILIESHGLFQPISL